MSIPIVAINVTLPSLAVDAPGDGKDGRPARTVSQPEPTADTRSGHQAAPWSGVDSFQNVTAEESGQSFIRQFGRFTLHDDSAGPDDCIAGTTSRAYALVRKDGFFIGGRENYGASQDVDLTAYLGRNSPSHIFATEKSFAALVAVGSENRLVVWGQALDLSEIGYALSGIRAVYANRHAFSFIYRTAAASGKWIGAIGDAKRGGLIPDALQLKLATDEPVSIRATEGAFAVLTRSGKVYAWGDPAMGGTIDPAAAAILEGTTVAKIFASSCAFCAVGTNNQPIVWGHAGFGGTMPPATLEAILDDDGVETIVAAQAAFCCITRRLGKAVAWGSSKHGGTMGDAAAALGARGGIVACKAAAWAFCIINAQGQAEAWGPESYGGTLPAANGMGIQSTPETSADAGDIRVQVRNAFIGAPLQAPSRDKPIGATYVTTDWTATIHAVDTGFCLITTHPDGLIRSITSWGADSTLISDTARQVLLGSYLHRLTTSNGAYLAIVRQGETNGCLVAWGESAKNGGLIPETVRTCVQAGVIEAHPVNSMHPLVTTSEDWSNMSGFFVRAADGSVAFWGGGMDTICLPPAA